MFTEINGLLAKILKWRNIKMLNRFQRPQKGEKLGNRLDNYVREMRESLDELQNGAADTSLSTEFILSLIEQQDEKGFWALIPSPEVDSDIRVAYWYEPTYIATAFMMHNYLINQNIAQEIDDFENALQKGLEASTGRGLKGHGHDDIKGRLDALEIFSKANVLQFVNLYPELYPRFSKMIEKIVKWLNTAVKTGQTKGDWGEEYKADMERVLKLLLQN
jgi:hypothetical protein